MFRAHSGPVGFLVFVTSWVAGGGGAFLPAQAQFPIRQLPPPPAAGSVSAHAPGRSAPLGGTWPGTASVSPYAATARPGTDPSFRNLAAWAHQPHPAVARIVVPERDGVSLGSGTLVDVRGDYGLVVTNWHVVRDAAGPIQVEFPGGFQTQGEVVKTDMDWDLAALSIRRPPGLTPVPITPVAPQPGQWLAIAGYGSGSWRMVSGPCTQYLAPGAEFPYELVELAAEARQGDSGGPIFNERGELAGVLFGSGPGYTSGSYGGRVLTFLASVVPGGLPGGDPVRPGGVGPGWNQLAAGPPNPVGTLATRGGPESPSRDWANRGPGGSASGRDPADEGVITPPPHATAYHAPPPSPPRAAAAPAGDVEPTERGGSVGTWNEPKGAHGEPLTPVQPEGRAGLVTVPVPQAAIASSPPHGTLWPVAEEDPRVAVAPTGRAGLPWDHADPSARQEDVAPASLHAQMPPRRGTPAASGDLARASVEELAAVVWRRLAGESLYDQAKTVLALVGLLALAIFLLRRPAPPPPHEME